MNWRVVDEHLCAIAKQRAALDVEEARWLLEAERLRVHEELGYGSLREYLERRLGYKPGTVREKLRVAAKLEELPAIRAALAAGEVSYSAVREVTRVATPETEGEWLDAITDETVRDVEDMVAAHAPGDLPTDPRRPDLEPRILRLELTPEIYARWLAARAPPSPTSSAPRSMTTI